MLNNEMNSAILNYFITIKWTITVFKLKTGYFIFANNGKEFYNLQKLLYLVLLLLK